MTTVTVLGGGTGSFNLLSGLKAFDHLYLQSIVTMMDSGGDSGRLRDEFGVLPPGDLRRCLVALSEETEILRDLFSYRFSDAPMAGRSFGNLFFLALTKTLGSESASIDALSRILKIRGRVIAVTWDHAHLCARLHDGTLIRGEADIDVRKHDSAIAIDAVFLEPPALINPEARSAILNADYLVLAPGDLYSSTLSNLLVQGLAQALQESRAPLIYVLNLMTKMSETDGYTAADHVAEVKKYAGRVPDAVLVHDGPVPSELAARYEREEARQVQIDQTRLNALGVNLIRSANLMSTRSYVRHDPQRTSQALLALFADLADAKKHLRVV